MQEESVSKLYGVLTSETVDLALRKAAADQLGVALQGQAPPSSTSLLGKYTKLKSPSHTSAEFLIKSTRNTAH